MSGSVARALNAAVAHDVEHLLSVSLQLRLADSFDLGKLRQRLRAGRGDSAQCRVVEDDVSGNTGFRSDLPPGLAKCIEQGIGRPIAAALPRPALAGWRDGDHQLLLAFEDRFRARPERQSAVSVGAERVAGDQRPCHRLHQRDFVSRCDPEDRQVVVAETADLLVVVAGQHL